MSTIPFQTPKPKTDAWREDLKTLAANSAASTSATVSVYTDPGSLENAAPTALGPWNGPSQILPGGRSIRLVLYGRISAENVHSIWIDHQSTYGDIVKKLATIDASCTFTVLEPIWGPTPQWTEANPKSLVGNASHVLYAVVKDDTRYLVGVVRTSLSDYPVAIFESSIEPSRTLTQAIIASHPELKDRIKSITGLLEGQSGRHTDLLMDQNFKSMVIINASDDPTKTLMERLPTGSIPPLLRVPFTHCENLMKQAYDLEFFALQIIHILRTILHIIISLAKKTEAAFQDDSSDVEIALLAQDEVSEWLRATPMLARNLQEILDRVEELMENVTAADQSTMQREIEKVFEAVCGDYPGAVDVRHSHRLFMKLGLIDREEVHVPIRGSGASGIEVTQPREVLRYNETSPKPKPSPPPLPSLNSYQPLQNIPTSTFETSAYRTPSSKIPQPPLPMPGPSGSPHAMQTNIKAQEETGAGISQYQCTHCGLKFDRPGRFEAHLNTHSDVSPHPSSPILTSPPINMGFTSTVSLGSHSRATPDHKLGVWGGNIIVPSSPPNEKRDVWREDLKVLADRSGLAFVSENHWDQKGFWWSFYYLTNPDGSKRNYLGSGCGTSQTIAKEYAAMQSYRALTALITTWTQNVATSSAASTGAEVSAHTGSGSFWLQELERLTKEKDLRFVCDQQQDSQATWWATYHLINPDGSKYLQLDARGAETSNIAMEHAAHDAVEILDRWIATWPLPGTAAGSINSQWLKESTRTQSQSPVISAFAADHPFPHITDGPTFKRIFLHKSLGRAPIQTVNGPEDDDNERLAYLGDQVLQLVCTELLFRHFPVDKTSQLSLRKACLVSKRQIARWSDDYDLPRLIQAPEHQLLTIKSNERQKAQVFQAYIAALFLQVGYHQTLAWMTPLVEATYDIMLSETEEDEIEQILEDENDAATSAASPPQSTGTLPSSPQRNPPSTPPSSSTILNTSSLKSPTSNALSAFNQLCSQKKLQPEWTELILGQAHQPTFTMTVKLKNDPEIWGKGTAPTKKAAQQIAADAAMRKIPRP